jgi:hypothetical protein
MGPVGQNQLQVQQLDTAHCQKYVADLPNPNGVQPRKFQNLRNIVWAVGVQLKNFCNPERIAQELEMLHNQQGQDKLRAADLGWFPKAVLERCHFFRKEEIDETIHDTTLPHNKILMAWLSLNRVYQIAYNAAQDFPTPQDRRDHGADAIAYYDPQRLKASTFERHLDFTPPQMPLYGHVQALAKFLNHHLQNPALSVDALKCFSSLKLISQLYLLEVINANFVDTFVDIMKDQYSNLRQRDASYRENGLNPTELVYRFYAYLDIHKDDVDVVVSERYRKLLAKLQTPNC